MNEMAKKKESTPGENLAKQIIEQYHPKSVADMQDALKDIFGPMFEAMLQGEMNNHLGYESNDHGVKSTDNRRNGYTNKKVRTSAGEVEIKVPRDRVSSFEPKLVLKRQKDVSEIEEWQGGDIVIFEKHIGIVSDRRNKNGVPYIIHHNDPWQTAYEQDILEKRTDIVGHYRISK